MMDTLLRCLFLLLVVTVTLLELTSGQTCPECSKNPPLDQNIYCTSDFVIRALIKGKKEKNGKFFYNIEILHTFKMNEGRGKKTALQTQIGDCQVNLTESKEYIISGKFVENNRGRVKLVLHECSSIVRDVEGESPGNEVSCNELDNLEKGYADNCGKCEVSPCLEAEDCIEADDKCTVEYKSFSCARKFSLCELNAGKCLWTEDVLQCDPDFFGRTIRGGK